MSQRRLLTAAMQSACKFSFPALDPCSDSPLLGVSAVKLNAAPGLISGTIFFLFSRCLEFSCITFVHHFWFKSCSALCVLPISNTTWASCSTSVFVQNILSQVQSFRTSAAFQLILLLDCWCLLRAPCCHISRTANTQIQELQILRIITFQTSHTACLYCTCWRQQQKFIRCGQACRQKLLASTSCSTWLHPKNGFAQTNFSKWHNFSSVVLAPDRTIRRSPGSLHLENWLQPMHMIRSIFCLVFH